MTNFIDDAPGPEEFEAMARAAFARIPEPFSAHLGGIVFRVKDFADAQTLVSVGLADKWRLSGLYHGRPLDEQSVWSSGDLPPEIWLYRLPIVQEWRTTGVRLDDLVAHVVIHEVGHHFGLSDADMHALEREAG